MLKFICLFALASSACAASIGAGLDVTTEKIVREIVPLLRFETDKQPDGSFHFSYEGGDQSFREETGVVENAGTEDEALEVSGSYRYIDADGQLVEVHYTAGRNGFVPVGTNILGEISALAKAAADLPNMPEEQELNRRARSKTAAEPAVAESENVPVVVMLEETKPVTTSLKKSDKIDVAIVGSESANVPVVIMVEEIKPAASVEKNEKAVTVETKPAKKA